MRAETSTLPHRHGTSSALNPPPLERPGSSGARLLLAPAIIDGTGRVAAPGAILLDGATILAAGLPGSIGEVEGAERTVIEDAVLVPAFVNAHVHLDLSHIGPVPHTGDFDTWVDVVQDRRAEDDAGRRAAVALGIELSLAGGTAMVGDIAGVGSLAPYEALRDSVLEGVSYVEVFGMGQARTRAIARMEEVVAAIPRAERGTRLGLQPHAPYSCHPEVFAAAAAFGRPLATHLAETLEELEFVDRATGPIAALVRRRGAWDETIAGFGAHPVDLLAETLASVPFVAAHLNYVEPRHVELLARTPITVAYCPRASAYFGHPHGGRSSHRYRAMLDAGINVALGTDSILCLDTPDRLSPLDEVRFLHRRDGTDPVTLLAMATRNGARALGADPDRFDLGPGATAGVLAIPARTEIPDAVAHFRSALDGDDAPRWIAGPFAEGAP